MVNSKFYFLITFILIFASCKKEEGTPAKLYYNYFPVEVGKWVEYDVMYIERDDLSGVNDTTEYRLREIIESTFIDNQGRPSLRIERYWRTDDSLAWTIKDVWYATRTNTNAEKIEENIKYLKLVFPVKGDKKWNGNVFNTMSEEEYEYDQIHEPLVLNSLSFDSTVTVVQRDATNFIEISTAYEIYAANIGLIKKEDVYYYISYVNSVPKYNGYALYQTVTAHGN